MNQLSWQQQMQELVITNDDGSAKNPNYSDKDNVSYFLSCACVEDVWCQGDNQSVFLMALQWTRIFILKVGRMYYVAPLLLVVLPLVLGLTVGYVIGNCQPESPMLQGITNRLKANVLFAAYAVVAKIWASPSRHLAGSDGIIIQEGHTSSSPIIDGEAKNNDDEARLVRVRTQLKSDAETQRESGIPLEKVPQHIAVIMDGNRRYGRQFFPHNPEQGHWDGSKALVDFCKWCLAERVSTLTVYAFSTENWNRPPKEVASLMNMFTKYCDELRVEARQKNIRIHVLSTDSDRIPCQVKAGMKRMVDETAHCATNGSGLTLNIGLSYGSRGEIVEACRQVARKVQGGKLTVRDISEDVVQQHLLIQCDPDVIIRTAGEFRLSNFLLWQLAYAELFFLPKTWPEIQKNDLLDVIRDFAEGRNRRFGR